QDGVTFKNYSLTVSRVGSNNASLKQLKVNSNTTVVKDTISGVYTTTVNPGAASVKVNITAVDPNATVTVNGITLAQNTLSELIELTGLETNINVVIAAQDGVTTKAYTLAVKKTGSNNAALKQLKLSTGTTLIKGEGRTFTTSVAYNTPAIRISAAAMDVNATIKVAGVTVAQNTPSEPVPLTGESTAIILLITAEDGITTSEYILTVNRAGSSNANLANIKMYNGNTTIPVTMPVAYQYAATVPNEMDNITIKPNALDATATIKINGIAVANNKLSAPIHLSADGDNIINLVVKAQDSVTVKTYTLTVKRLAMRLAVVDEGKTTSVKKPDDYSRLINKVQLVIPKALSPNGDGTNDVFTIDGISAYPENRVMVMDKQGRMIYQATGYDNYSKVFDGRSNINGKMQLPGTYFYSVEYREGDEAKRNTGFIIIKY
ncbi:MAG: T9SS type B sorting domain-containing protein, partial [Sphingobacteriales bacterium]